MRVKLDTGTRSVELENDDTLYDWQKKDRFIGLVLDAMRAIGCSRSDVSSAIKILEEMEYTERVEK